jgi:undecaprenyl diphosphate synthase
MRAAALAGPEPLTREGFSGLLAQVNHDPFTIRDVDLLIRSGGEQRLSDFLLWECAYAEFHFARCMWPEFTEKEFFAALSDFEMRERRFGGVPAQAAS